MKKIPLFDVVCPNGNEEVFVEQTKKLGFKQLIFLYFTKVQPKKLALSSKLIIKTAYCISNVNEANSVKPRFDYVFAPAERQFFESKQVDFVFNGETSSLPDFFYQKRGGLDPAICALANERGIVVLGNLEKTTTSTLIGRFSQNSKLCKKHKIDFRLVSFAKKPLEMRSSKDLKSFNSVL